MKYLIEREVIVKFREYQYVETDSPEHYIESTRSNFDISNPRNTILDIHQSGEYSVSCPESLIEKLRCLPFKDIYSAVLILAILECSRAFSLSKRDIIQYMFILDLFFAFKQKEFHNEIIYSKGHYGVNSDKIEKYLRDLSEEGFIESSIQGASQFSTGYEWYSLSEPYIGKVREVVTDSTFSFITKIMNLLNTLRISIVVHSTPYWDQNDFFSPILFKERISKNPDEFQSWVKSIFPQLNLSSIISPTNE